MQHLLDLDRDDLLEVLGAEILAHESSALPRSKDELIAAGKKWLDDNLSALQGKICASEKVKSLMQSKSKKGDAVLAVADLISSLVGYVPAVTVAALLVQVGYEQLCP